MKKGKRKDVAFTLATLWLLFQPTNSRKVNKFNIVGLQKRLLGVRVSCFLVNQLIKSTVIRNPRSISYFDFDVSADVYLHLNTKDGIAFCRSMIGIAPMSRVKSFLANAYNNLYDLKLHFASFVRWRKDLRAQEKLGLPNIMSIDETLDRVIDKKLSICRYGDGEFKLMDGDWILFQQQNGSMASRLREICILPPLRGHFGLYSIILGPQT